MPNLRTGNSFTGYAGKATEILFELEPGDKRDVQGTVAMWFLDCPGQSPAWRHYHLAIIHLRPIEGVKPAVITEEGATHEVILAAMDPAKNPSPTDIETWSHLRPLNFVGQLRLPSDDAAKFALSSLAHGVVIGLLWAEPPLAGQRDPWAGQLRKLEEHAAGKHSN